MRHAPQSVSTAKRPRTPPTCLQASTRTCTIPGIWRWPVYGTIFNLAAPIHSACCLGRLSDRFFAIIFRISALRRARAETSYVSRSFFLIDRVSRLGRKVFITFSVVILTYCFRRLPRIRLYHRGAACPSVRLIEKTVA